MPEEVPRFITKKWRDVHHQPGNAEDRYKPSKQIKKAINAAIRSV